jgi:hypothetical protein
MRPLPALGLLLLLLPAACDSSPKRLDPVPAPLEARVKVAEAAIGDLKQTLSSKLMAAVKSGGPEAGIDVCGKDAHALTQEVAARHGVRIGRTSQRLRNTEQNASRPWLSDYLADASNKKASEVERAVFDLGSSLGVVQPLATQGLCVTCHGDPKGIPAGVQAAIAKRYPKDRAVGFAEGDVRGVVWVEIEKEKP